MDGESPEELIRNPIRIIIEDIFSSPYTFPPSPPFTPASFLPLPPTTSSSSFQQPPQARYGHYDKWGIQCCVDFDILPLDIEKDGLYSITFNPCRDFFLSILTSEPDHSNFIDSDSSSISLQETKHILKTAPWQLEIFRRQFEMVEDEIDRLEDEFNRFEGERNSLEDENNGLEGEVDGFENELNQLDDGISWFENEISGFEDEINGLGDENTGLEYSNGEPRIFQRLGVFIPVQVDQRNQVSQIGSSPDQTIERWLDVTDRNVRTNPTGPLDMRCRMGCPHHQEWPLDVMCYVRYRDFEEMNPEVIYTPDGRALDLGDGVVWGYWS